MPTKHGLLRHYRVKYPDKATVTSRIDTFKEALYECSIVRSSVDFNHRDLDGKKIEHFAEQGFFVDSNHKDLRCFYCGFGLCELKTQDLIDLDLTKAHSRRYPYCTFNKLLTTPRGEWDGLELSKEDSELACVVCFKNQVSVALLPCGHTLCKLCCVQLSECCFCKRTIHSFKKIFFV